MTNPFDCFGKSIVGDRQSQQDAHAMASWACPELGPSIVVAVADGMGGHSHGGEAAKLAVTASIDTLLACDGTRLERLQHAVEGANTAIRDYKAQRLIPVSETMGCTLIVLIVSKTRIGWASVGDSLLLMMNGDRCCRLNRDHSFGPVLDHMAQQGEISESQAQRDPRRSQLRSAIFGEDIPLVHIDSLDVRLTYGDQVIVASDGILALETKQLVDIVRANKGSVRRVESILRATREACSTSLDNTTVVAIERNVTAYSWLQHRLGKLLPT